ncbi:hypothetical protein ACWGJ9_08145 [Curtobacterium citreum]
MKTTTIRQHATIAAAAGLLLVAFTGCASSGEGTITGTGDSKGVQYIAGGSTGDGADDVEVTVDHSAVDGIEPETTRSIVPWRTGGSAYGFEEPKTVTMTVKSLTKDGWASCEIRWSGQSVTKKVSGEYAVAECAATLAYPGAQ